ncbi:ribose-5-phosphate isomerase A [Leuconostoc litchii]|uniref:Ribose-5-phosphate isomerase A n=1 Tax=Leuconostoc litchii TaxID=1981069 RepID=A0A6P2CMH9_9LACO|nr:ribose-5-phosphate isomerase RpiA [Leuconostoc litchii]TYC47150.1 ribose-5-phosphate isomerase RpiA [Leuconostoc litchii]GMA69111.1 ribose-5-phosphate isomerase A [Leuconostoc litchii]
MEKKDLQKKQAGTAALTYIKNDMVVGLGTGSTVAYFLEALANSNLNIIGVTTSTITSKRCSELDIPIVDIDAVDHIDITVDGADEIDIDLNGIKGGGDALLMEKIVAKNSKENIWIVDSSKVHKTLGLFPLPVEVIPYGSGQLLRQFTAKGFSPQLRCHPNTTKPIITDAGHYIIDCYMNTIDDPYSLADYFERQVGVVEHGLFLNICNKMIIGGDTVKIKKSQPKQPIEIN